jgi:hypothetical protein
VAASDQIAGGEIGERVPAHNAPEQADREGSHQADEQHETHQGAPHGRAHDRGNDDKTGEHEQPVGPVAPAPTGGVPRGLGR